MSILLKKKLNSFSKLVFFFAVLFIRKVTPNVTSAIVEQQLHVDKLQQSKVVQVM